MLYNHVQNDPIQLHACIAEFPLQKWEIDVLNTNANNMIVTQPRRAGKTNFALEHALALANQFDNFDVYFVSYNSSTSDYNKNVLVGKIYEISSCEYKLYEDMSTTSSFWSDVEICRRYIAFNNGSKIHFKTSEDISRPGHRYDYNSAMIFDDYESLSNENIHNLFNINIKYKLAIGTPDTSGKMVKLVKLSNSGFTQV